MREVYESAINGSVTYEKRDFESECFENATYEIYAWDQKSDMHALFSSYCHDLGLKKGDLLYTRLPSDDTALSKQASDAGFYFVEQSIEPFIDFSKWDRARYENLFIPLTTADDSNIEVAFEIANSSFHDLRFQRDLSIAPEKANLRYKRWLENAYRRGDIVSLSMQNGEIAGFVLWRFLAHHAAGIALNCIRPAYQGKGLGKALFASCAELCRSMGAETLVSGISSANLPSLNGYVRAGFLFRNPTAVFHYNV